MPESTQAERAFVGGGGDVVVEQVSGNVPGAAPTALKYTFSSITGAQWGTPGSADPSARRKRRKTAAAAAVSVVEREEERPPALSTGPSQVPVTNGQQVTAAVQTYTDPIQETDEGQMVCHLPIHVSVVRLFTPI